LGLGDGKLISKPDAEPGQSEITCQHRWPQWGSGNPRGELHLKAHVMQSGNHIVEFGEG